MTSNSQHLPLAFNLRRSPRAKNTRIIVTAEKVEVVAPLKTSERRIQAFVVAKQDWIQATLKRLAEKAIATTLAPAIYCHGAMIPYQGQHFPLSVEFSRQKTCRIDFQAETGFLIRLPTDIPPEQQAAAIKQTLTAWMKHQARQQIVEIIELHAPRFNLIPRSIRIKTQKSRWGSCGPHNDINMNWLLMLAPQDILEYVVVHELCHIQQKNHSATFWQLVEQHIPDYRQRRLWLKQQGASLMQGL